MKRTARSIPSRVDARRWIQAYPSVVRDPDDWLQETQRTLEQVVGLAKAEALKRLGELGARNRLVDWDEVPDGEAVMLTDALGELLRELPSLPSRQAILLGWATPVPTLVEIRELTREHDPRPTTRPTGTLGLA